MGWGETVLSKKYSTIVKKEKRMYIRDIPVTDVSSRIKAVSHESSKR